jgi:hypothetical protein
LSLALRENEDTTLLSTMSFSSLNLLAFCVALEEEDEEHNAESVT